MGDVGASEATWGFAFRGQRILAAAFTQLITKHQLGVSLPSSAPPRVLFGGCSAGARGAMANLENVQSLFESHNLTVDVRALIDSGMWLDFAPASPDIQSLSEETQTALGVFNGSGVYGSACAAAYPASPWLCSMGQYRMPYVETPYLLNAAQFDSFQLDYDTGTAAPFNASMLAYAASYQAATLAALSQLPAAGQSNSSVFSAACYKHCASDNADFWSVKVTGVSLRDVAFAWWQGEYSGRAGAPPTIAPPPPRTLDTCTGFRCGTCRTDSRGVTKPSMSVRLADAREEQQQMADAQAQTAMVQNRQGALTAKASARRDQRQERQQQRASASTATLRRNTLIMAAALALALASCALIRCASWVSRSYDPDRTLVSVMLAERAPPPARRPDSPNQAHGRRGGGGVGASFGAIPTLGMGIGRGGGSSRPPPVGVPRQGSGSPSSQPRPSLERWAPSVGPAGGVQSASFMRDAL